MGRPNIFFSPKLKFGQLFNVFNQKKRSKQEMNVTFHGCTDLGAVTASIGTSHVAVPTWHNQTKRHHDNSSSTAKGDCSDR